MICCLHRRGHEHISIDVAPTLACRYFPYVNDTETVPQSRNQFIEQAQKDAAGGTQAAGAATQRRATQAAKESSNEVICLTSDDEDEPSAAAAPHPIFEVFWQVRWPHLPHVTASSLPMYIVSASYLL